jgi:hypothetical protein
MVQPVNVEAFFKWAKAMLPGKYVLITRPENVALAQEVVENSPYGDRLEVLSDDCVPEGLIVLTRRDQEWTV